MKSVLLISHGSYSPKTKKEVKTLVENLKKKSKAKIFYFAFLEIASPSIPEGIDLCVADGATEVIVLFNFLNSGKHVDEDIPRIVKAVIRKYPRINVRITKPVGQHVNIVDLFLELIAA